MLVATALWALFAFGGTYGWTQIPLIAAAFGLTVAVRPRIAADGSRLLDSALCVCLLVAMLQLIPIPQAIRLTLAPALAQIDHTLYLAETNPSSRALAPLTIDPAATIGSGLLTLAVVLLFWCARATSESGAERRTIRLLAAAGLVASGTAIVQHATAPTLLYGIWQPVDPTARPYSPFVNRNDFAAWLVLAIPLTIGYLLARLEARHTAGAVRAVTEAVDATTVWLAGSACVMAGALVALLSRSGLIAGAAGTATFAWLSRRRIGRLAGLSDRRPARAALILGVGGLALTALAFFNADAMTPRIADALANGVGSRRDIWRLTAAMIRDFWPTGVGLGAYPRAMSAYQPPHDFAFNHAHNEYLQIVADGGIALAAAVAIALAAGLHQAARQLRSDRTPLGWIRIGALSGIAAIAIQSVWETPISMPATAVLFALCAAIALRPLPLSRTPADSVTPQSWRAGEVEPQVHA